MSRSVDLHCCHSLNNHLQVLVSRHKVSIFIQARCNAYRKRNQGLTKGSPDFVAPGCYSVSSLLPVGVILAEGK